MTDSDIVFALLAILHSKIKFFLLVLKHFKLKFTNETVLENRKGTFFHAEGSKQFGTMQFVLKELEFPIF